MQTISGNYTVSQKKTGHLIWCFLTTLAYINRFIIFFTKRFKRKCAVYTIIKTPTSPEMCCYTTLWNFKIQNASHLYSLQNTTAAVFQFLVIFYYQFHFCRFTRKIPRKNQTITKKKIYCSERLQLTHTRQYRWWFRYITLP